MNGHKVEFDNTPFTVTSIRKLDCQFGHHYYKEQESQIALDYKGLGKLVVRPTLLSAPSTCILISALLNQRPKQVYEK